MRPTRTPTTVEKMARECVANQARILNRVVTGIYEAELRPLKLKASQMVILVLTAERGQVRAAELCRALQMDTSTLSRNIERMRARGWVEAAPAADGRSHPFRLTPSGKRILRDAVLAWERAQVKATDRLGSEGVASLFRTTRNLRTETSGA